MGNTRTWTREFNARNRELQQALKAKHITKAKGRRLIERAKAGRPSDLAEQARISLALRRIAGKSVQA